MSYENTLIDQSSQLGFSVANRGKEVRGVSLPLIDELIKELSRNETGNRSLCTNLSDAAIAQLRGVLQEVSNRTFNEAVPMIKNVLEQLNKVINPDIPVAYSQFDCRPVIFSNLWDSPLVAEMVERGRNLTPDAVSYVGMINSADDEEYADLVALASTGLGSFDDELAACLGQYSEEVLRNLFVDTFVYGNLPATDPRTLMTDVADGTIGFNAWLVIALWARKLYDIAPKASSVSLGRYRELCVALERHAHWVMAGIFVQRRAYAEAGRLVIQAKPKCVYVLNDLYIKYLSPEEGGSIEAIMGVIVSRDVSGQSISLIDDLKANKAQLETAWNRHVQASQMTHTQSANAQARRQLMLILDETAKWHFGDDAGNIAPEVQGAYRGALDRIASGIQSLPVDFVREAHRHVFELVGNVFYPNSDIGRLLQCLREIGDQKDSGLSAEEIRVIATINFVGDWLSEIVVLGNHGHNIDFQQIRPINMGMESIDWSTVVKVGAGAAILALVGTSVYLLIKALSEGKADSGKKGADAIVARQDKIKQAEQENKQTAQEVNGVFTEINTGNDILEGLEPAEAVAVTTLVEVLKKGPIAPAKGDEVASSNVIEEIGEENVTVVESPVEAFREILPQVKEKEVKVFEGTLRNVRDFLGEEEFAKLNEHTVSAMVHAVHYPYMTREFVQKVKSITDVISRSRNDILSLSADVKKLKEDMDNGKTDDNRLNKLNKEVIDLLAEMAANAGYGVQSIVGSYAVYLGNTSYNLTKKPVTNIDELDKLIDYSKSEFNHFKNDWKEFKSRGEREHHSVDERDMDADVGKWIDQNVGFIKANDFQKMFGELKDIGVSAKKKLEEDTGKEDFKEAMALFRWVLSQSDTDPQLVNGYVELIKTTTNHASEGVDKLIEHAVSLMKNIFDSQAIWLRVLKASTEKTKRVGRAAKKLKKVKK